MPVNKDKIKYVPSTYGVKRPDAAQKANEYIREWEQKQMQAAESRPLATVISPAICFSRKIGAGVLEIADILARKLQIRVADREILDHIASNTNLSNKTVAFFDERYPGKMVELSAMLFGEKSFVMSDYIRNFISAVFTLAEVGTTIFVGRGTHLILPRDRVLAVRCICSDDFRIRRLAALLGIDAKEAEKALKRMDKEQHNFFKKAYGKTETPAYEFDLVINCDHIKEPGAAAEIVAQAFRGKFPDQSTSKRD
jgi:hypothetical protein